MLKTVLRPGRLAVAAAAVILLVGLSVHAEVLEQVLVKVNGEILTKTDLESRQAQAIRQISQQRQMNDAELKQQVEKVTPQILVDTIDELLLLQRGREMNYRLSDEQFKGILDNIKKENKIETEQQFQAALTQEGMSLSDLRKSLEKRYIIERLQQTEVFGKIDITEEQARKYYDEHRSEFTSPAAFTLRELLVKVPADARGVNAAQNDEAKAKAEAARARALKGEAFDKIVAEMSESPSKANGGIVGPVNQNEIDPAIAKTLLAMKPGDLTEVLRTSAGYEVFRLESKTDPKVLPFDQARNQIADRIFASRRQEEFEKYMKKLRATAIIEWKNAELKKLYEQAVAAPATASVQQ